MSSNLTTREKIVYSHMKKKPGAVWTTEDILAIVGRMRKEEGETSHQTILSMMRLLALKTHHDEHRVVRLSGRGRKAKAQYGLVRSSVDKQGE